MIHFLLRQCTDCDNVDTALCSIEGALAQYGKDGWHNISYMTQKPVPNIQVKRLIYYQQILNTLKANPSSYCPPYSIGLIASRGQAVAGSISPIVRRNKFPTPFTTTTTTTTSTSTTTTTSTSTSTTTTTTTSHTTSTTTTTTTT